MQTEAAKKIIEDTFNQPYDLGRFKKFIHELTKSYEERNTSSIIPDNFKEGIKSAYRIGKFKDDKGNEIDLVAVTLQKEVSLDRARTLQRNYIARYLKGQGKEAALVAFVSPESGSWRFSLVRRELGIKLNAKGKAKAFDEISPARRFSFHVGQGEKTHTAKRQLMPLLESDSSPSLASLERAFNIETVTDEFFEEYRELFGKVKDQIDEHLKSNPKAKKHFDDKDISSADFAKRLLGQIVFLYFLQKKGWLGVPKDKKWGEGSRTFLRDLYDKAKSKKQNFFNEYLEKLFYEALNRDHSDMGHYHTIFDSRIPFLNGGLFDAYHDYDWHSIDIELPNEIFSKLGKSLFSTDGIGILDVFDRYNFTVAEDEPLEREVAIDPEMLGKVFERLLPAGERGDKGTFYTPREIVHYMCQESLIAYLGANVEGLDKTETEDFIRYGDLMLEHDAKVLRDGANATYKDVFLGKTIQDNLQAVDVALAQVKVCDPAIGSGAFPVGMMTEIVRARKVLALYRGGDISNYALKRDTIHNSLYGVDLDPGAIEIAKLRLWLSLVVDEENFDNIQALPNLDYKIMQGNSLLQSLEGIKLFKETLLKTHDNTLRRKKHLQGELTDLQNAYRTLGAKESFMSPEQRKSIREEIKKKEDAIKRLDTTSKEQAPSLLSVESKAGELAEQLKKLHTDFFRSASPSDKKKIRARIEELEWQLIETSLKEQGKTGKLAEIQKLQKANVKPYFLWKLHFSDVFTEENAGFDIVIANPPYVSHDKIENKNSLADDYTCFEPFADLYCYFIELALKIANARGTMSFITSNSYLRADYGAPLREFIRENANVHSIVNLEKAQVFDTAIVNTAIATISKLKSGGKSLIVNAEFSKEQSFLDFVNTNGFYYEPSDFFTKSWTLIPAMHIKIINHLDASGKKLKDLNAKIRLGIATGANEAFLLTPEKAAELIKRDKKNEAVIKRVLRGREINRFHYDSPGSYLLLTRNEIDVPRQFPDVYEYLDGFGEKFKKRGAKGKHWTNLRACAFFDDFKKEKIIWIELTDRGRFALCTDEIYLVNSAYFMLIPDGIQPEYLLGILNSRVIYFYLKSIAETSGMGTTRWINNYVQEFPIPLKDVAQDPISKIVRNILSLRAQNAGNDTQALENLLDKEVYKLYGLTHEQITVIKSVAKVSNRKAA